MSKQFFEDLLAKYKKSNKQRKEDVAIKAGYKNGDEYKAFLEASIKGDTTKLPAVPAKKAGVTKTKKPVIKEVKPSTNKVTVHVVDIVDCSGSMSGSPIRNANEGVNKGVRNLKKDDTVDYTYSLCHFADRNDIRHPYIAEPLTNIMAAIKFGTRGCTALYDAIIETVRRVESFVKDGDKVLVNIYTDGGDNGSYHKPADVKAIIDELEGIFTFTFIGTKFDVDFVTQNLRIDASNSLVYDGSAQGLQRAMNTTLQARAAYVQNVSIGADVSKGFFKNIVKK